MLTIVVSVFAASKPELNKLFEARQVIQFAEFYPVGHRSTNYKKFFESDVPYPIKFKSGYEPYVLVSRKHMPWYDERFRGYGWDKVSPQLFQTCRLSMDGVVQGVLRLIGLASPKVHEQKR